MLIDSARAGRSIVGLFLAACCLLTIPACTTGTGGPPPPIAGPFDGVWSSPLLGYDFQIDGPVGRAVQSSRVTIHVKDEVFRMIALDENMRFSGKQLLPDDTWHEIVGELKADGTISCNDGKTSWVLERK